jgi:hypothetical protein
VASSVLWTSELVKILGRVRGRLPATAIGLRR